MPAKRAPTQDVYSADEIARAAGVAVEHIVAALDGRRFVAHQEAVRIGRELIGSGRLPLATFGSVGSRPTAGLPLVLSSTLHAAVLGTAIFVATLGLAPAPATLAHVEQPEQMRLVFVATPGPGGGGGGGGLKQQTPPPKALRKGNHHMSSPMPVRRPPQPTEPVPLPPEPKAAPIEAEPLPTIVAPIVSAPADTRDRAGVLTEAGTEAESRGPGEGGGVGTGKGTGLGEGDGTGIGPGSGGGIGGGPFRPGSGIQRPRLLREVRADYSDEARRAGIEGDVLLEIVVRRDGTVGDVRLLRGLRGGLNERAIQAVRQWRFAPATRHGSPVDVIVEVAVEFKLR